MALFRSKKKPVEQVRRRPSSTTSTRGAFSYYASSRSQALRSEQTVRKAGGKAAPKPRLELSKLRKSILGQQFGTVLLAIVLVASVISVLQIDNNPRIVILGNTQQYALHSSDDYRQAVTDRLRGSLVNSNKITIDTQSVIGGLRQEFPEIYDASVVLPLVGHRPTVYIELTRPALVLQTPNAALVIDANGRLLKSSADIHSFSTLNLPIISDQSNLALHVGDVALSSANVAFVEDVARQFKSQQLSIAKLVLPAGKEELDVYPSGVRYYVKFNLHEITSREQSGTYFAVRQQLTRQGISPKQYVDVRLVGRAYYL